MTGQARWACGRSVDEFMVTCCASDGEVIVVPEAHWHHWMIAAEQRPTPWDIDAVAGGHIINAAVNHPVCLKSMGPAPN